MERIRRWLKRTPTTATSSDHPNAPYRTAAGNAASRRCVVHAENLPRWTRWLGADDTAIYFTGDLSIYSLLHGATVSTRWTDPRLHVANATFGESGLLWNSREPGPDEVTALWCTPTSGGGSRKIATSSGAPASIAMRGGQVFWVTTRHELDPTNDKVIKNWCSTIHVHDVASGEPVAPPIEREASFVDSPP